MSPVDATETQQQAPLRVTRLVESNFGRVISADITPGTKSLVVLRGPNEAGKTSTLNGLIACLAGKGSAPDIPVRIGAEHAQVEVELSDAIRSRYRVTKSYKGGKEWLNVQTVGEDGMAIDGNRTATNAENVAMIDAAVAEHQQQRPTLVSVPGSLAVAAYNPNAFNPNEL